MDRNTYSKDYYAILRCTLADDVSVLKRAWTSRMAQLNPLINRSNPDPAATREAQDVNEAWSALSDASLRPHYDLWYRTFGPAAPSGSAQGAAARRPGRKGARRTAHPQPTPERRLSPIWHAIRREARRLQEAMGRRARAIRAAAARALAAAGRAATSAGALAFPKWTAVAVLALAVVATGGAGIAMRLLGEPTTPRAVDEAGTTTPVRGGVPEAPPTGLTATESSSPSDASNAQSTQTSAPSVTPTVGPAVPTLAVRATALPITVTPTVSVPTPTVGEATAAGTIVVVSAALTNGSVAATVNYAWNPRPGKTFILITANLFSSQGEELGNLCYAGNPAVGPTHNAGTQSFQFVLKTFGTSANEQYAREWCGNPARVPRTLYVCLVDGAIPSGTASEAVCISIAL